MKKHTFLLIVLLSVCLNGWAQDIITLTNGKKIEAKVWEINPGDVKYKDYGNPDGPMITVLKVNVLSIQYANGTRTVFNGGEEKPNSGHFVRGSGRDRDRERDRDRDEQVSYNKPDKRKPGLYGWYFGVEGSFGSGNASTADGTYTTTANGYSGFNVLATKMFNPHWGIQFGIGDEQYNYDVTFNSNSIYSGHDNFTISSFRIPVRAVYLSNTRERVGFYAIGGLDFDFNAFATDNENENISSYYSGAMINTYISAGVNFRTRRNRINWMIGPFYKTSLTNCYSGSSGNIGLPTGNSGTLQSAGLSISFISKLGRRID